MLPIQGKYRQTEVETFLSQWIEKYYFTRDGAELNSFTYQTKGSIFEVYLGFMGVIVFVMIFVSVIFIYYFPQYLVPSNFNKCFG